ncbi:MAG TPA: hypothetical protein VKU02_23595 [Gemmataceae bacterium]|nr:hypothetical protein [Gemmataceae bacterium]
MQSTFLLVWLTNVYPLWRAWQANRQTSLLHTIYWVLASWVAWGAAVGSAASWPSLAATASCYTALSLTGCGAVAVLGARRPGVNAWNMVVGALLAVDLLALAESWLTGGTFRFNPFQWVCVAGPVAVGVLNYVPTPLAPAALSLLLGCALELMALVLPLGRGQDSPAIREVGWIALVFTPWIAFACLRRAPSAGSEFDRTWRDFRNRFGFIWGQRLREQFNRSAANAGWPVVLRWQGLRLQSGSQPPEESVQTTILATLRALLKRFGPAAERSLSERDENRTGAGD